MVVQGTTSPILRPPLARTALCGQSFVPFRDVAGMSTCPNNSKGREAITSILRLHYKRHDHTLGIPPSDWIDTPPSSPAKNVRQVSTSTSSCLFLNTGCVTFHLTELVFSLPILVRSASNGGFETTSVFAELASRNCIYVGQTDSTILSICLRSDLTYRRGQEILFGFNCRFPSLV